MSVWAIILAAGSSTRMRAAGIETPKQFLTYNGIPLFWQCCVSFAKVPAITGIVLVFPADWKSIQQKENATTLVASCKRLAPSGVPVRIAYGGERRQDSVRHALVCLPSTCSTVLVHDAARPFASATLINRVITALNNGHTAVIPGINMVDTVKRVDEHNMVQETLPRNHLRAVQTPQGFQHALLIQAHQQAIEQGWEVTDDATLIEQAGGAVFIVAGETENCKITHKEDMTLLESTPARYRYDTTKEFIPCTGFGYDVHRYGGDRPVILGGVPITCDIRIAAHSDGDTVLHALMDAILGCLCLGDIGKHFPDTSAAFEGISSGILLAEVLEMAARRELLLQHVDITIVAQVPKIAPHREAIAKNIAKMLQLSPQSVNVKATTEEHLGFTGEKKGMKAIAVVTALRPKHTYDGNANHSQSDTF